MLIAGHPCAESRKLLLTRTTYQFSSNMESHSAPNDLSTLWSSRFLSTLYYARLTFLIISAPFEARASNHLFNFVCESLPSSFDINQLLSDAHCSTAHSKNNKQLKGISIFNPTDTKTRHPSKSSHLQTSPAQEHVALASPNFSTCLWSLLLSWSFTSGPRLSTTYPYLSNSSQKVITDPIPNRSPIIFLVRPLKLSLIFFLSSYKISNDAFMSLPTACSSHIPLSTIYCIPHKLSTVSFLSGHTMSNSAFILLPTTCSFHIPLSSPLRFLRSIQYQKRPSPAGTNLSFYHRLPPMGSLGKISFFVSSVR